MRVGLVGYYFMEPCWKVIPRFLMFDELAPVLDICRIVSIGVVNIPHVACHRLDYSVSQIS